MLKHFVLGSKKVCEEKTLATARQWNSVVALLEITVGN